MKTDTQTLVDAMRVLADEIESGDGAANAAIREAADRLDAHWQALARMRAAFGANNVGVAYRILMAEFGVGT